MTKARSAVMDVLVQAGQPLSASGVMEAIEGSCDQATVYRSLHHLEEAGLAESFVLYCSEHGIERYYASCHSAHRHWFHCESCHRFIDLGECRMDGLVSEFESDLGLSVTRHTMYLSGLCAACNQASL
ncbi:MAG: transcriptional repressor [Spirochaetia bacterium]|nr:transcriptional repressor [Spirochaetia bacterium]